MSERISMMQESGNLAAGGSRVADENQWRKLPACGNGIRQTGSLAHTFLFTRRRFLQAAAASLALGHSPGHASANDKLPISLAEPSFHRSLKSRQIGHLDLARTARETFGIEAVEYSSRYFPERFDDEKLVAQMNARAADHGVRQLLIVIDDTVRLDSQGKSQTDALARLRRWADVAQALGCHSISINPHKPREDAAMKRTVESVKKLTEYAVKMNINVLLNSHKGLSLSEWLVEMVKRSGPEHCGTLPCFGEVEEPHRYQAFARLMPHAKGVHARSFDFDDEGKETRIDFARMLKIILDSGYRNYIGIHYDGQRMDEVTGIRATKALLERLQS